MRVFFEVVGFFLKSLFFFLGSFPSKVAFKSVSDEYYTIILQFNFDSIHKLKVFSEMFVNFLFKDSSSYDISSADRLDQTNSIVPFLLQHYFHDPHPL